MMIYTALFLAALSGWSTCTVEAAKCEVIARTESGPVCGRVRNTTTTRYASFRSVPYAKQPLGELRFKELQPAEPWKLLNATEDGPICPQTDVIFGRIMTPVGMNESCIHANIHVPLYALPKYNNSDIQSLNVTLDERYTSSLNTSNTTGLPIFVFIHGGSFALGSGNADLYGPELMVSEGVIVITFNYRLNVFGFLSLNTTKVPGNNGFRDMITLLKWVQRNARFFGGDPTQVTLAGQSAGASSTHLLTLSDAAQGLFQRAIMMSGSALPSYYTTLPIYAQTIASNITQLLGINSTDPDVIHQELITMDIDKIVAANAKLQDLTGLFGFFPVVESTFPGVTPVLDKDPEQLILQGKGKDIPLLVGYTNVECEMLRNRFVAIDILSAFKANPLIILPPPVVYSKDAAEMAKRMADRYLGDTPTIDEYIKACTDTYFGYAQSKAANYKQVVGGAPMYLYNFSYTADQSPLKLALNYSYTGAAHFEDLVYIYQVHSVEVPYSKSDLSMQSLMTSYFVNFIKTGEPTTNSTWKPINEESWQFLSIKSPTSYQLMNQTEEQRDIIAFYDSIRGISNSTSS